MGRLTDHDEKTSPAFTKRYAKQLTKTMDLNGWILMDFVPYVFAV